MQAGLSDGGHYRNPRAERWFWGQSHYFGNLTHEYKFGGLAIPDPCLDYKLQPSLYTFPLTLANLHFGTDQGGWPMPNDYCYVGDPIIKGKTKGLLSVTICADANVCSLASSCAIKNSKESYVMEPQHSTSFWILLSKVNLSEQDCSINFAWLYFREWEVISLVLKCHQTVKHVHKISNECRGEEDLEKTFRQILYI